MTSIRRRVRLLALLVALALMVALSPAAAVFSADPPAAPTWDLAKLFSTDTRLLLLDQNEDGFTDALNTSIVVPGKASGAEAAAAAEVSARLGFETMGLNLPAVPDAGARQLANPIIIGQNNALRKAAEQGSKYKLLPLDAGQGAIQLIPGALGSNAVLVAGLDDAGTFSAAEYLAARLPYVWEVGPDKLKLADVEAAVAAYGKLDPQAAAITRIVVAPGKDGLAQLEVELTAGSSKEAADAHQAFQLLMAAHQKGQDWDKLNYANIGELVLQVVYDKESLKTTLASQNGLAAGSPMVAPSFDPAGYDLSSLYGNFDEIVTSIPGPTPTTQVIKTEGLLADTPESKPWLESAGALEPGQKVKDFTPDNTKATLIGDGNSAAAVGEANFAARLGLETTGVSFPLAQTPDQVKDPSEVVNPVLFGAGNPLVQDLQKAGKVDLNGLKNGQGLVSVVPRAFVTYDAVVVAGKDDPGTAAASDYAARRLPYLWEIGRGNTSMSDIEDSLKDFFSVRSAAGQAAAAVLKVDEMVAGLSGTPTLNLTVYLEEKSQKFADFLKNRIQSKLPGSTANVMVMAMKAPQNVFVKDWSDPGEVADFQSVWDSVKGSIGDGTGASIEVRLSEPPEELDAIQAQLQAAAPNAKITVLSAYKQGFSWLDRVVGPAIKGKAVDKVTISFQDFYQDGINESNWKFWDDNEARKQENPNNWIDLPTRWLQELYPIDDVWVNEKVVSSREQVVFDRVVKTDPNVPLTGPTYSVIVTFKDGTPAYTADFTATYNERDYYPADQFPSWVTLKNFKVHPTTGLIRVTQGTTVLEDEKIKTDPERYWDYYQNTVWPALRDYVLSLTDGNMPTPDLQPFFREFKTESSMSEPNYELGVRQELISSQESLHEDIYFVTLDYFSILMNREYPDRSTAPGQIAPWIRDAQPGTAPSVRVTLDALNARDPKVVLKVEGGSTVEAVLTGPSVERPSAAAVLVAAGADAVDRLSVTTAAADAADQDQAVNMVRALEEIHEAGAFTDQLSWAKLNSLEFAVSGPSSSSTATLSGVATGDGKKVIGPTTGVTLPSGSSIVRWDGPIGYEEVNAILKELDKTPEINVWLGGISYLGQNSYVADVMLPIKSELYSQAKASTWKPTFEIEARQHANEVSSTSSGLRLIELMTKDPSFKEMLKKVNVTFVPYWNADGATFAYQLQKEQPTWMLHAGRYNATGTDISGYSFNPDTLYREAPVVTKAWETWLPDIVVNDHGFPSHEWVQQFAGYTPPAYSTYWIPRGTFYGYMSYLAFNRTPIAEAEAFSSAVRDELYNELKSQSDIMSDIQDWKDRYYKYANQWMPDQFPVTYYGDPGQEALIYWSASNVRALRNSFSGYPWITTLNWTTEIADETAQGAYMDVCARAHFFPDVGQLKVLAEGDHNLSSSATEVKLNSGELPYYVYYRVNRERPVTPVQ